jgi:hypothetical protein
MCAAASPPREARREAVHLPVLWSEEVPRVAVVQRLAELRHTLKNEDS